MGKLSREKGKRFEREFATILRERFGDPSKEDRGVRRGIQSRGGGKEAADVSCDALAFIHFECKHMAAPNPRAALEQAIADAEAQGKGQTPVAICKANRGPITVTMSLDDWLAMVEVVRSVAK